MSGSLGESNPGVDRYASGVDSGTLRRLDTFLELTDDLSHWIASIIRVVVAGHVSNRSARMHQHHTAACLGANAWHFGIDGHSRHVVHYRGSFSERRICDVRLHRIEGDRDVAPARSHAAYGRYYALPPFPPRHRSC